MTRWVAVDPVRVVIESGPESLWTQWGGLVAVLAGAIVGGAAQAWAGWLRSRHEVRESLREKRYELYIANLRASRNLDLAFGDYARATAKHADDQSTDVARPAAAWEDAVRVWMALYSEVEVFASGPMQVAQNDILDATHKAITSGRGRDIDEQRRRLSDGYVRVVNVVRSDFGVDELLGGGAVRASRRTTRSRAKR